MLADPAPRTPSAHHRKMAITSWAQTTDRSARTLPARVASLRRQLANLEAQGRGLTDADAASDAHE
jgi:hypothetical protein